MAVAAANTAAAQGIDVYTIFYGGSSSAANWFATLKRGNGISLTTPDPTKIATLMGQVCASMPHRLVW
jgi:hypothetical protein